MTTREEEAALPVSEQIDPASGRWEGSSAAPEWDKAREMDYTYTNLDRFIRLSLGENAHFSNAMYDGDYSLTLLEAQLRKYRFVAENLGITAGTRVLDLGCGWGGWLKFLKDELGAVGIGVNLSRGQVAACQENGLEVYLRDARYIEPGDFGIFNAVTAFGSLEHCATVDDYLQGRQDEVYDDYFRHVADLLPDGGRFYLQSMVFSRNMIPYEEMDIEAPEGSTAHILALLTKHNPDSWLPYGHDHIERVAAPYFRRVFYSSGRLDYIQTQHEWLRLYKKFNLRKYLWFASLIPTYLRDREFRYQLALMRVRPNRICFEREIMDHARLVFEKIPQLPS
ncbi:SAM-dependent methyltransferase [Gemmatimonadota bacterium]